MHWVQRKSLHVLQPETHKPILCCFMGIIDVSSGVKFLQEHGIPVFRFPEHAAKSFGALYKYAKWVNRQFLAEFPADYDQERAAQIIREVLEKGHHTIGEVEGSQILNCYGFTTLPTKLARNAEEAWKMADDMGYPVAMKIVSPQILHKSDVGGVELNINDCESVKIVFEELIERALDKVPDAFIDGVLIEKMAPKGEEIILGMNRYRRYGPLLMFGLGGVFVEVFKDVVFRVAPIGRNESRRMIGSIRGNKILKGYRGKQPADTEALEKALVNLSALVMNHPEINELDINPLLVHERGKGATVADCRIILKAPDTNH